MIPAPARPQGSAGRGKKLTEYREFQDGELIAGTRYRVLRLIGVGGMGSVYEVEHVELGKRFVLKALLRELSRRDDLVARLRNEWRALARLQHANIVNVTDAGTSDSGVPFYVMERLDGETLAARLRQQRRLHVLDALNAAVSVLDALSAAHDIGVIHRDVKPANIFMVQGGGLKLLDFGIAKIADASSVVTARGLAVGTPRYMSPEQARGERVDGRSDVYATGLILFEMIAGVGPFDDARDANELLLAHLAREAPPLSSIAMGVAPELERIVAAMLAKDCRERPPHARAVAEQLRLFAARHQQIPATDALTVQAPYSSRTVSLGTIVHVEPRHDPTTRPEGLARAGYPAGTTSDAALTLPFAESPTHTTLTVNTSEVTSVPNTTIVSLPALDGSTTLEIAAFASSAGYGTPGPASYSSEVERPERTEILGDYTPATPPDSVVTRTHVPIVEGARPISVTPPPVVDAGREVSAGGRRRGVAVASLFAFCVVASVAFMGLRHAPGARVVSAAPVASVAVVSAALPLVAAPVVVAPPAVPAIAAPATSDVAPVVPVSAESASARAVSSEKSTPPPAVAAVPPKKIASIAAAAKPVFLTKTNTKPANSAVSANRAAPPPAKPKHLEFAMPASGL